MATVKLIGANDATSLGNEGTNCLFLYRFQAVATGNVTEIRIKCHVVGHAKVGIYTDASGSPTTLLGYNNTDTSTIVGWNTIALNTPIAVTSGTYYWLGVSGGAGGSLGYSSVTGGVLKYKAFAFGNMPNPAETGYIDATDYGLIAGWGILVLSPSSIIQPVSYGSPKLNLYIKPSSLVQQVAYGTPTVLTSALIIQPSSIVQVVAFGIPTLRYPQTISPQSIIVTIAYGTPSVGILGFIRPQSIVQQISIGIPTILKYVWHVILDGQYAARTPEINRAYIIGRDQYGNPVYGTAVNTDEVALVGERLDFQPDPAIPTTDQAGEVASAVLAKMRLMGKRGAILIPPNCGQELFDVVQISDAGANQSAVKFRVVGLGFEYNPKQARYQHNLTLGAP
jgi:hypothetical protein